MSILLPEATPKLKAAREALTEAREQRTAAATAFENAAEDATTETLDELQRAFDDADTRVAEAKEDVDRYERIHRARHEEPAPTPIRVIREPLTYQRERAEHSFLLDLARSEFNRGNDLQGSRNRLQAHRREMDVELETRKQLRERAFSTELGQLVNELERRNPQLARALTRSLDRGEFSLVEKRAINRVDGTGGEFVPPLWLLDEYAAFARAARPFADSVRGIPLPSGTDTINVPRITQGSLTGIQTGDNTAVASQDPATATVTAPVRTIAGQVDSALQLLDQSPIAFDEIMFEDLLADYAMQLDTQLLSGSGAAGQLLGVLNTAGINTITFTSGAPTVPLLWPKLADALNQASNARKIVPTHYWSHSRRWFWMAAQLDSQNRPFFVAASNGPTNAMAVGDASDNQGGPVTNVLGVPWYLDLNVPTNLGAGTNEDRIIAARMLDLVLFEGDTNVRVLKEVLSGTLGIRFQVYAYCAFTAGRFPGGVSVAQGTGLVTPTF